ncbi:uncharacterized protein LOC128899506 [Dryobates pubescens]|uniref:uncharacterized protein LOC128899506 n=1 Tax=Dryobates pubescens TaxID=118200 RepID=UPI0023B8E282|nr:uncharacterized protein LOC128899506 [Dryobates pubescens]
METRIPGAPEAQVVSIIVICLLIDTIKGWEGNMYLNVSQELALQTNLSNCWICTELPRGQMRTPLFGVASMNWTWGPSDWVTTSESNFHNCQHGKDSSESLGPKFDLLIVDPSRTLFVESNEISENKVGWRNLTGLGCSWNYSSPGEVSGVNPWVQGNGCTSSKENRLDVVGAGVALLSQTSCLLPYGYWWLCGDGYARKSLPPKWTGVCTAGYLTPQITVHHEILPRGYWRTLWRRHRRTANPLVRYNTGYHSFVRALIPALGVAQLEKAIVNISATMEIIANSAADAVQNLQVEVKSVSSVSLQNRLALDMITAEMGGVCTLINTTCCTYVGKSGQIKTDVQNIWEQGKVLHEVSKDDTSYGLSDLWEELTSWMPNMLWLKQLLLGIVMIILLIILLLVLVKIIMCAGKRIGSGTRAPERRPADISGSVVRTPASSLLTIRNLSNKVKEQPVDPINFVHKSPDEDAGRIHRRRNQNSGRRIIYPRDPHPIPYPHLLQQNLQMYSGLDTETPLGQALLKTQFVAKSWEDIRKKLEKIDNWQDRGLDELLREAQKVYVRRDEENHKKQVRMMVAAVRESQGIGKRENRPPPQPVDSRQMAVEDKREERTCFYCGKKGHLKRNCRSRIQDEKMFKED